VRPCGLERGAGEEKGTNKTQDDGPAQRLAARRRHVEGRVRTWCRELPLTAALWAHGPSLGPWLFHDGPWAEVGDLTLLIRRNRLAPLIGTRAKARLATGMTQASTRADRGKWVRSDDAGRDLRSSARDPATGWARECQC